MNNTNRAFNRGFLLVVGLLLIGAGVLALALALERTVAAQWRTTAGTAAASAPSWVADPVLGTATPLALIVGGVAIVLALLLLVFILRQGRGRTAEAVYQPGTASATRIDLAVPRALLEEHLGARDELVGLRISAYEVRGTPMLKVSARCRRGVSPRYVGDLIGRAIGDLEAIVGTEVPALIQLSGGFRSRTRRRTRLG